ncbi:hypothetical protein U732_1310 [Clostridium argentinense CDC 2741]|uniref:Uncharacterized protein n=1 Tax=Clostridium argentinense CDC 2741 TaxID=1418104 RepID=A0A0C1U305_9CLOT|nr:hypothetical protein [Clostridium argentinense]KIE47224.1 hypothetical protein U732_1310 [Clostridium argentinense CDC 2741]
MEELNIIHLLAEALSTNEKTYGSADKIYNEGKIKFITAAKNN